MYISLDKKFAFMIIAFGFLNPIRGGLLWSGVEAEGGGIPPYFIP